jgi:hypothetical protein
MSSSAEFQLKAAPRREVFLSLDLQVTLPLRGEQLTWTINRPRQQLLVGFVDAEPR